MSAQTPFLHCNVTEKKRYDSQCPQKSGTDLLEALYQIIGKPQA